MELATNTIKRDIGQFKLRGLALAMKWLADRGGFNSRQLGALFGTSAANVRKLIQRHAFPLAFDHPKSLADLQSRSVKNVRKRLRVREDPAGIQLSKATVEKIANLNHTIETISRSTKDYLDAVKKLKLLLSEFGRPGDVSWLRLLASLHQQISRFLVLSGHRLSGLQEASLAIDFSIVAHSELHHSDDLRSLSQSCLIASNACLISGDWTHSLGYLNVVRDAANHLNEAVGAEYHRQQGVISFMNSNDERAREHFEVANRSLREKDKVESEPHLVMMPSRQMSVLGSGNWEQGQEALAAVGQLYAKDSLQHVVTVAANVAAGMMNDSHTIQVQAMELLQDNRAAAAGFGDQKTRIEMFALTPRLPERLRRIWIRYALYQNAARFT